MNTVNPKFQKRYQAFIILVAFSTLTCCVSESGNGPLIGGCKYESDTGYVKFIGYGDTISTMRQVIFNFHSNKIIRLPFGQFYDTNCINDANLKPDTSYFSIRNRLIEGSCAGDYYEIGSMQCITH